MMAFDLSGARAADLLVDRFPVVQGPQEIEGDEEDDDDQGRPDRVLLLLFLPFLSVHAVPLSAFAAFTIARVPGTVNAWAGRDARGSARASPF